MAERTVSSCKICNNSVVKDSLTAERLGEGVQFQRIRRITGYLVGTMDKWNDAKRAEERDRVTHSVGMG